MNAKQLIKCNTLVNAEPGWCGRYVSHAFGLKALGVNTALDAWYQVPQRKNQDFPKGVYFAVWFTGPNAAGHIAIVGPDGDTMWDSWSPSTQFKSQGLGCLRKISFKYFLTYQSAYKFLGWSEYINKSTRVIELIPDEKNENISSDSGIKPGCKVKVKYGSLWSNGMKPISFVFSTVYTVYQIVDNGKNAIISPTGKPPITGRIAIQNLIKQ